MWSSRLCCFYSHARDRIRLLSFISVRLTDVSCRQNAEVSTCLHLKFASVPLQSCDDPECETNSISHQAQLDEVILLWNWKKQGGHRFRCHSDESHSPFVCSVFDSKHLSTMCGSVVVFMSGTFRNSRKSCHFHLFITFQTLPHVSHLILTDCSALWLQWWSVNATYFEHNIMTQYSRSE